MDFTLDFDSLSQRCHRVLQVLLLLVILLTDVRVDVSILCLLVLNVSVEEFVDSYLELLMVIDVVGGPEDGILEAIDELLIPADDILLLANHALNQFLSGTQILHHEP